MTRLTVLLLLLAVMLPRVGNASPPAKIGVLLYSDEPRYIEAFRGIKDGLARAGYREPSVRFEVRSAGGSKAAAVQIARDFRAGGVTMMVTLGTNATLAARSESVSLPILFCMVYDPVQAGLVKTWASPGTNATGTSPRIDMRRVTGFLTRAGVRSLLVLYTPTERNSEIQLNELLDAAGKDLKIEPLIIRNREEIEKLLPLILPTIDAVYVTGSSVIGRSIERVVELTNSRGVLTITHLKDMVEKGVMVGISSDPYRLGLLSGAKGAAILAGRSPAVIPVDVDPEPLLYVNDVSLRHLRKPVPSDMLRAARHLHGNERTR